MAGMPWLFFAIAAPALYGISNFIDKFLVEKRISDPLVLNVLGGGSSFIFGLIILIVRGFPLLGPFQMVLIIISGALVEFALLPYYKALALDDTSRVVPLFQAIPIIVLVLSYVFLGESLSSLQFIGFFAILIGGFILSLEKLNLRVFELRKSFWYMILADFIFAVAFIILKFVITPVNFWTSIAYELIAGEAVVIIILSFRNYRSRVFEQLRKLNISSWLVASSSELVYLLGRISWFYAFALASASLVSVMLGFQPFFVLLLGLILSLWFPKIIEEDITKPTILVKLASIVLIFAGVWFVGG